MKNFIILILFFNLTRVCQLQAQELESKAIGSSTRSNVVKIIYSGLGGALLGLSTLSFYGKPEEHLSNVALGLAVGLIAGATVVIIDETAPPTSSKYFLVPRLEQELLISRNVINKTPSVISQSVSLFNYQMIF